MAHPTLALAPSAPSVDSPLAVERTKRWLEERIEALRASIRDETEWSEQWGEFRTLCSALRLLKLAQRQEPIPRATAEDVLSDLRFEIDDRYEAIGEWYLDENEDDDCLVTQWQREIADLERLLRLLAPFGA